MELKKHYETLVTFGEAMIRFAPLDENESFANIKRPSAASSHLRSIGGDELNVAVGLSLLGVKSVWVSSLPKGPLGNLVRDCALQNGVDLSHVHYEEDSEIGTFYIIPEEKRVHYQRKHSAWANQKIDEFSWKSILDSYTKPWVHVTGISPLTGPNPSHNWQKLVETAFSMNIPVSMDFNHRKLLGTLQDLWNLTTPFASKLHVLIFSLDSLKGLNELEGFGIQTSAEETSECWTQIMQRIVQKYGFRRLACCFKTRDSAGLQKRWSCVVDHSQSIFTTSSHPTYHHPKDECGGGSAWAAGYIDACFEHGEGVGPAVALRRADLLAALCQEVVGDHSDTRRPELTAVEKQFHGVPAYINVNQPEISAQRDVTSTFNHLKKHKAVAIFRAKNPQLAIERVKELVELGCRAVEITMDTANVMEVLQVLCNTVEPTQCIIGVGTVFEASQIAEIAKIQGKNPIRFVVSPINPDNFTAVCHSHGLLAIPSAFTPNEIWKSHLEGAKMIKLFPSQLWNPSTLKDFLTVGKMSQIHIMPSGGVNTENSIKWLEEGGATIVGLGSKLVGNDMRCDPKDPKQQEEAKKLTELWNKEGRENARKFFQLMESKSK